MRFAVNVRLGMVLPIGDAFQLNAGAHFEPEVHRRVVWKEMEKHLPVL